MRIPSCSNLSLLGCAAAAAALIPAVPLCGSAVLFLEGLGPKSILDFTKCAAAVVGVSAFTVMIGAGIFMTVCKCCCKTPRAPTRQELHDDLRQEFRNQFEGLRAQVSRENAYHHKIDRQQIATIHGDVRAIHTAMRWNARAANRSQPHPDEA